MIISIVTNLRSFVNGNLLKQIKELSPITFKTTPFHLPQLRLCYHEPKHDNHNKYIFNCGTSHRTDK